MQALDLILYGDSIFESILGTSVGHKIGRARGIPEVWSRYRGTSARKVLSITGTCLAWLYHFYLWTLSLLPYPTRQERGKRPYSNVTLEGITFSCYSFVKGTLL